jgi:hypothetical protein
MKNRSKSNWLIILIAWAALALLGAAWSIATPIGGSPDEPAHLIKAAAVARGELLGTTVKGGIRVTVPEYVAYSQVDTCFAFHANTTPNCAKSDPTSAIKLVPAVTSAGLYNPVYYAIVGWPSRIFGSSVGIYAMRIVSDLVVSFLLAIAFGFIAQWRRRTLSILGFATALTPMVLFLEGNVNPNSLEIAATLAVFVGVLTILREPSREFLASRSLLVFLSAAIAVNMRGLSLLWVAVAVLVPFILAGREQIVGLLRTRPVRLAILGTALGCVFAGVWLLSSNSLGVGESGTQSAGAPGVGTSHLAGFAWNLGSTFFYGQQVVGLFGWLDTASPAAVYFVWSLLVGAIALLGFVLLRGRTLLFAAVLIAAVLLLPPILQGIYITSGGIIWQGRYILPVFVCVMVGIAACVDDVLDLPTLLRRRLVVFVSLAWAGAQILAFATTLKRYAVGAKAGWPTILHPVWSPPGGVIPVVALFTIVTIAGAIVLWRFAVRTPVPQPVV